MRKHWSAWLKAAAFAGVTPEAFWRLSLREWRALTGAVDADVLSRTTFHELAKRYPDETP
ncbi:hypothetical protein U91I_02500 [alpha proteobacterium U9-1i]|nr:hypothetical protein U91I_02500 [alpha proteobacterium U9-1i]